MTTAMIFLSAQAQVDYYRRIKRIYDRSMDMMGHSTQGMYIVAGNTDALPATEEDEAQAYMQLIEEKAAAFRRHAIRVPREELAALYRIEPQEELGPSLAESLGSTEASAAGPILTSRQMTR